MALQVALTKFLKRRVKVREDIKYFVYVDMLGILVGIVGGLGAFVFIETIKILNYLFFQVILPNMSVYLNGVNISVILIPAIGGAIIGPIVYKIAPETKGHGIPEVIEAIRIGRGRIRKRVAFIKIIASSITIGSGGSAGREGAIGQIGASFGSLVGDLIKVGARERKLLVVSGLVAGISATFNAPLGGAIFGLEVLYGGITIPSAIAVILASVIGAAVIELIYGPNPAYKAPTTLRFTNPIEIIFYFLLGIIMGFISVSWVKLFYLIEDGYDKMRVPPYLKPAIGGFATGLIAVYFIDYGLLGVGYEAVDLVLAGGITSIGFLVLLGFLKMLATANTVGSGGSGGIFAPSLFIGAMFGGAFGLIFHSIAPTIVKEPFTYSLAGMAALFAGAAHTPLSMVIMIPELSHDYALMIPMMASTSMSYIISRVILGDSNIYTLKLKRRGLKLFPELDLTAFEVLKVKDFMTKDVITVTPNMDLSKVYELIKETHHDSFPVVDEEGNLIGLITSDEVLTIPFYMLPKHSVRDVMQKRFPTIFEDESIKKAIEMIYIEGAHKLIVVDRRNPKRVKGIISKTDIVKAYGYLTSI